MSKYTTELHFIVESGFDLGMDVYPVLSEEYRTRLNAKIYAHYWFHEIGFETALRFKHYLNVTMNEIMPYYDQLLRSELLVINPLLSFERKKDATKNVGSTTVEDLSNTVVKGLDSTNDQTMHSNSTTGIDTTQDTTVNSTRTNNANNTVADKDVYSDTPQGLLSIGDISGNVYASKATIKSNTAIVDEDEVLTSSDGIIKAEDSVSVGDATNNTVISSDETATSNSDNTTTLTTNEVDVITENGFEIPLSDLLIKYRQSFLNVDVQIITELKDLFMMVY